MYGPGFEFSQALSTSFNFSLFMRVPYMALKRGQRVKVGDRMYTVHHQRRYAKGHVISDVHR